MSKKTGLASLSGFDEATLEINRKGKLSASQRNYILRQRLLRHNWVTFMIGYFLIFFTVGTLVALTNQIWLTAGLLAMFVMALLGGLAYIFVTAWREISADWKAGRVEAISGVVSFRIETGRNAAFYLQIQEMEFYVTKDVMTAFSNHKPYKLYYAPHSQVLLAAEAIEFEG